MIEAAAEAIPFTVEVKVLTTEVKTFEVMTVAVATTPFTSELRTLVAFESMLVVPDAKSPQERYSTLLRLHYL